MAEEIEITGRFYGVDEYEMIDADVYPNPTNGQVSINSEVATQIYVYDLCGRQIMNTTIEEGYNVIDISHLANGCYLMKTGNNKVVKLIKR